MCIARLSSVKFYNTYIAAKDVVDEKNSLEYLVSSINSQGIVSKLISNPDLDVLSSEAYL